MDTEERASESEFVEDADIDQSDLSKLTAMMDESGDLPPHGVSDEVEEAEQETPEKEAAPEETPKTETDPEGQTAEVEYDGKKYTVPADLKDALLRQSDYTRKTQEVASERAAAQQERAAAQQAMRESQSLVGHYAQIQQIDNSLQQVVAELQRDPNLGATDPLRNLELRQLYSDLLRSRDGAIGGLNNAKAAIQQAEISAIQKQTQEGSAVLAKEIPNWGPETQKALLNMAVGKYGYKPEELAGLTDPRAVKILHDAHQWQQLQAKKPAVEKQIKQAPPKPIRSSSTDRPDQSLRNDDLARLRRTGRDDDAVAALKRLF